MFLKETNIHMLEVVILIIYWWSYAYSIYSSSLLERNYILALGRKYICVSEYGHYQRMMVAYKHRDYRGGSYWSTWGHFEPQYKDIGKLSPINSERPEIHHVLRNKWGKRENTTE